MILTSSSSPFASALWMRRALSARSSAWIVRMTYALDTIRIPLPGHRVSVGRTPFTSPPHYHYLDHPSDLNDGAQP